MQLPHEYQIFAPWIQLLLFSVACVFAYFTYRQRQWKTTCETALVELKVYRESSERLRKENRELIAENVALRSKTDLNPLALAIHDWTKESRGHFLQAMQRLEGIHAEQTEAMKQQTEAMKAVTRHLAQLSEASQVNS